MKRKSHKSNYVRSWLKPEAEQGGGGHLGSRNGPGARKETEGRRGKVTKASSPHSPLRAKASSHRSLVTHLGTGHPSADVGSAAGRRRQSACAAGVSVSRPRVTTCTGYEQSARLPAPVPLAALTCDFQCNGDSFVFL